MTREQYEKLIKDTTNRCGFSEKWIRKKLSPRIRSDKKRKPPKPR